MSGYLLHAVVDLMHRVTDADFGCCSLDKRLGDDILYVFPVVILLKFKTKVNDFFVRSPQINRYVRM